MPAETASCSDLADPSRGHGQFAAWRNSVTLRGGADLLAAGIAASLPWSTTATSIFVGLWLLVVTPTIDWGDYARRLRQPAYALPFLVLLLALVGTLWSDDAWADRLHAAKPVAKLVIIPLLLYHFSRSDRGMMLFAAFLCSCALLAIWSWVVLAHPHLKITATASDGVPVKNYINQSQEFTLCAFALLLPTLAFGRESRLGAAISCVALILLLVTNMLFVASGRTALVCMPVLLALFAWRHLSRPAALILLAGAVVASALAWSTSP
ncbi:hypothetical protein [Bradyrhizobium liaoningense]|uniref:hypothetical protein n=1 Tax=Bradyrhizobium liaoningense TaxID=43992 RepID=UPI00289F3BF0|nr:hypothetical protein [Bradyrhizobium liaoningense]